MKLGALACVLTLVATAGFARSPNEPLVDLAEIFSPVEADSPATEPPEGALFAAKPPEKAVCGATANCYPYTNVSCTTEVNGATCQAVDRNCAAGQRGYVRCHTSYTYCPVCPSSCPEGQYRYVVSGCCKNNTFLMQLQEQCTGGQWVQTGNFICADPCGDV